MVKDQVNAVFLHYVNYAQVARPVAYFLPSSVIQEYDVLEPASGNLNKTWSISFHTFFQLHLKVKWTFSMIRHNQLKPVFLLLFLLHLQCDTDITYITHINRDIQYSKYSIYITVLSITLESIWIDG